MHLVCLRRSLGAAILLFLGLVGTTVQAEGQDAYTISGRVVDAATQRPIPAAAVLLDGTQLGTQTRTDGTFALIATVQPGSYTLRISQLGHGELLRSLTLGATTAVALGDIPLQPSVVELEEIVVTGTGGPTQRRELGNTVATVRGDDVNQAPGAQSVDKALQGKVVGALISQNNGQPGGGVSIRLRGTGSILGGAEPLIVIDGVIMENNSDALVSLGANAGRGGAALSNSLSDIAPGDIERVEVIKGAAAAALYGSRANNGVIQIFTKRGSQGTPRVTYRVEAGTGEAPGRFNLNASPVAGRGDVLYGGAPAFGAPIERFDYQDEIFRRSTTVTNQLSVTGGNEGTSYYASANWQNETGIVRGTALSNINTRLNLTQQISDALQLSVGGSYIRRSTNYVPEGEQTQGVITTLIFTPTSFDPAYDPALGRYPYSPVIGTNALDVIENWRAESNVNRFNGNLAATFTPTEALTVSYLFGLDQLGEEFTYYIPPASLSANFAGSVQNPIRNITRYNNDLTIAHDVELNPTFSANTTLGFRQTSDRSNEIRAAATGLSPGQTTVGGGGATPSAGQGLIELRTLGGFLQERIGVNDRLFITGGVNLEASSAFGSDERWQLFPRLGASWVLDEEPFWAGSGLDGVFSSVRLRAAYGETGGQPPSAYSIYDNYIVASRAGKPALVPGSGAGNAGLKPERQREYEAGVDASFFDSRVALEFTWYNKNSTDLVLGVPLPLSSGFSTQLQNIGSLTNRGIELALNTLNVNRSNFQWNSRITYAANRSRVEDLVAASDTLLFGYLNYVVEGHPVGVFYGSYYPRDASGEIVATGRLGTNCAPIGGTEGIIRSRARDENCVILRKFLGSPEPDFTMALSNDFNIGNNIQLSFLLDGRFGNEVANFSRRISEYFGAGAGNEDERCVTAVNNTVYCEKTLNVERHLAYEEFVEDGSFVKLREAALRYTADQPWVQRLGAESLILSLAGRNLHTWTNYSGIDPEVNLFSANTVARAVEFGTSPIPRVVTVGLTVNF